MIFGPEKFSRGRTATRPAVDPYLTSFQYSRLRRLGSMITSNSVVIAFSDMRANPKYELKGGQMAAQTPLVHTRQRKLLLHETAQQSNSSLTFIASGSENH